MAGREPGREPRRGRRNASWTRCARSRRAASPSPTSTDRATVDAFLGPTDPKEIEALPALTAAEDATAGSGRYGDAWRLPLGHEARASAGVRLALLGDRRKGVGLRADGLPDIDWRRIDGGEVTIEIRSNPDDPNSEVVKRLTRTVEPFWMARYPVTVAQFQAFLEDCYRDGAWRLPPGFRSTCRPTIRRRSTGRATATIPPTPSTGRMPLPSAIGSSARLDFEVRLPTEYEWQLRRHRRRPGANLSLGPGLGPGSRNPGGRTPSRASSAAPRRSACIRPGASPAGILDMAGTLWEWCQNAFDDPDNDRRFPQSPQEDRRVLRGGSWNNDQDVARSADRNRDNPNDRNDNVGFRVVCSSPSSGTDH